MVVDVAVVVVVVMVVMKVEVLMVTEGVGVVIKEGVGGCGSVRSMRAPPPLAARLGLAKAVSPVNNGIKRRSPACCATVPFSPRAGRAPSSTRSDWPWSCPSAASRRAAAAQVGTTPSLDYRLLLARGHPRGCVLVRLAQVGTLQTPARDPPPPVCTPPAHSGDNPQDVFSPAFSSLEN